MRAAMKDEEYKTLETMAVLAFFCLVFGIAFDLSVLVYASACLLFIGLFVKVVAAAIARLWMRFAFALGAVNTKIILTLTFFLILTPIAVLYRWKHGDFLSIREKSTGTLWHERNHRYRAEDLQKQW